jgi:hypothetical protein
MDSIIRPGFSLRVSTRTMGKANQKSRSLKVSGSLLFHAVELRDEGGRAAIEVGTNEKRMAAVVLNPKEVVSRSIGY